MRLLITYHMCVCERITQFGEYSEHLVHHWTKFPHTYAICQVRFESDLTQICGRNVMYAPSLISDGITQGSDHCGPQWSTADDHGRPRITRISDLSDGWHTYVFGGIPLVECVVRRNLPPSSYTCFLWLLRSLSPPACPNRRSFSLLLLCALTQQSNTWRTILVAIIAGS